MDRAEIRRVRFHDLRHSWASNLLEAGENIATVSRALGHANAYITLKTDAQAIPKPRCPAVLSNPGTARLLIVPADCPNKKAPQGGFYVLAERQGFEPWNTCEDVTGIPV
ncbi:tyrosine-type recombinase/integrase, partial [Steroidobacter agaridevorans]|uniref:tyrosine-type recombinase/integrase n=1 Tax=Steroidobacter agaridevorans TaxID=2695856 RepID=UPI00137A5E6C